MSSRQQIALHIPRWAAWAPGVTDPQSWRAWAEHDRDIGGDIAPDVKFVAPMMRRRLSRLSRMVFRVVTDCLAGHEGPLAYLFCSRYGEYNRSFDLVTDLANGAPASPSMFSNSVHNSSASLFSIEMKDKSYSTTISGEAATLETAFVEAWSLLSDGIAPTVLLTYHDEPLPELYRGQPTTVGNSAAFAMLLQISASGRNAKNLQLSWETSQNIHSPPKSVLDSPLQVLKLLLTGGKDVVVETERLVWTWSQSDEAV